MWKISPVLIGVGSLVALAGTMVAVMAQQRSAPADTEALGKPAPPDAYVYIGWPNDGETIRTGSVKVWFGARNIGIAPAGVDKANTGHHHLLINEPLPNPGEPIPNDKTHLHYGAGQTETHIDLPPGTYKLQLVMGDADHVPHNPMLASKPITIHVKY
jgi:hypothetical protein